MSAGKQAYVETVLGFAGEVPGRPAVVLEAGVGVGVTALAVAGRLSAPDSFSAIDRDAANIDRLRSRLDSAVSCQVADLVVGDIATMDAFGDGTFDVVGSDTVVSLLGTGLHRPFVEMFRVLRPGAALVLRELLPPQPVGMMRRDLFLRLVLAARTAVGDGYAMLPPELVAAVLTDVGFEGPRWRTIHEPEEEPVLTQWYPLSDSAFPLRQAFEDYYAEQSARCSGPGGSVADSYLLVARRPGRSPQSGVTNRFGCRAGG